MKIWQKNFSIVVVVVLVFAAFLFINTKQRECCLCNSFRYHAPCLIDLETGLLTELDLYFPHKDQVAELADPQSEQSTFSFIRLGNVYGFRDTAQARIEVAIPPDNTYNPALCKACRKKLKALLTDRYVLADLYAKSDDRENRTLIPITDGMNLWLRCYCVTAVKQQGGVLKLTVQGNLES